MLPPSKNPPPIITICSMPAAIPGSLTKARATFVRGPRVHTVTGRSEEVIISMIRSTA